MKPLVVYYAESFCGLSETYVYRTAQCLAELFGTTVLTHERHNIQVYPDAGWDVHVESRVKRSSLWRRAMIVGRSYLSCGVIDSASVSVRLLAHLFGTAKQGVVYAQFGSAGVRMLAATSALGLPLIVNFHNCDVTTWLAFRGYRRNLQKLFCYPRATFLVPSQYIASKLIALGAPQARTHVYHNPIPIPELPVRTKAAGAPIVFLHAGRLVPLKGIAYTLRAFAQVPVSTNCQLRILGGGPDENAAHELARQLGVEKRVQFLGARDFYSVQKEMAAADVFVLHSITTTDGETEGLPIAICEAFSYALPVVATKHAGIPEVVLDGINGMLVEERDADAMGAMMSILQESESLRRQLGIAGRAGIIKCFSAATAKDFLKNLILAACN